MNEAERIRQEVARRDREIPPDFYSLDRPANRFLHDGYTRAVREMVGRFAPGPFSNMRVLEIGCGSGQWLEDLGSWGVRREGMCGIDLDLGRVARARERLPGADLRVGDATALPWASASFDLVLQSTVFTSILDAGMQREVAGEMQRVLAPEGVIVWYDFVVNNPRNSRVRGIPRAAVARLFPGMEMHSRRTTLLPPLARLLVPRLPAVARMLATLPLLQTHLVVVLRSGKDG